MADVVFSRLGDDDQASILFDLATHAGLQIAIDYASRVTRLYTRLAEFPDSGSPRPTLGRSIRIGVIDPYVVFYQTDTAANTVTVLRVLHGRRRVSRRMLR